MSRSWWLKTIFLFFLILASVVILTPTVIEMVLYPEEITQEDDTSSDEEHVRNPALPDWYNMFPKWLRSKKLSLGLDLQGGLLLNYSVDVESAVNEKLSANANNIQSELISKHGVTAEYTLDRSTHQAVFTFDTSEHASLVTNSEFLQAYPMMTIVGASGNTVTFGTDKDWVDNMVKADVESAVETIRERIDGLGVAQPSIRTENQTHIVVELPGLSRSGVAAAERLISTTAVLTFKLVAPDEEANAIFTTLSQKSDLSTYGIYRESGMLRADDDPKTDPNKKTGKEKFKAFLEAHESEHLVPNGREIVFEKIDLRIREAEVQEGVDVTKLPTSWTMRLVQTDIPVLTGENVDDAFPANNSDTNMPYVALKLDKIGGDTFYEITKQHVNDKLAILMDDTLVSDPVIRSEIPGGNVSIEMGRGNRQQVLDDVNNLVVSLRSGALPAPIRQESKSLVGPSLGRDSIESGMVSLLIGFIAVFAFMIFYYKGSGVKASVALLLNLLFIMAGMASMGAVLTLPGIAGIVLTIGMAVDSNVIVFERIREELRTGETPRKSIIVGFDKALWTILDSNITTAIAAVVLMNFGSGPVKGFAVTLLLGIIATVYTAFYVTRNFFELESRYNHDSLSI